PAVLLAVRLVWGFEADRRLARTQREIQGRGLRGDVREIAGAGMENDANGVVAVMMAAGMLKLTPMQHQAVAGDGNGAWLIYRPLGLPETKQHIADAREANMGMMAALD